MGGGGGQMFGKNELIVSGDAKLEENHEQSMPDFLLGDEIFPLKMLLMRSFHGRSASKAERAQRVIENAFLILTSLQKFSKAKTSHYM